MNVSTICFLEEDLRLFCEASGDRNPLHLEEGYASRTAYGQRVVYGVLGVVACLRYLQLTPGQRVSKVTADFHRPMFLHVNYRIESSGASQTQTIRLFDGTVPVLTLVVTQEESGGTNSDTNDCRTGFFELKAARDLSWADARVGLEYSGSYTADAGKRIELCRKWHVTVSPFVVETLLWSSYFVGMEFPGRNALFFRLSLDFSQEVALPQTLFYECAVSGLNKAVEQAKIRLALHSNGSQAAHGVLTAFIRPTLPSLDMDGWSVQNLPGDSLKGKVALVIGASRGLGAALTMSLVSEGAQVTAVSRSASELGAALLPDALRQNILFESADSASVESLSALRQTVIERFGKLDFLVCNAFPPIPALRLETNAVARVQSYLKQATDLVLTPLCVFLPLLNENHGCVVIISSSAVEKPVREWPHYVAAKNAVESLGTVAPLQYPHVSTLIVRPERLLTDMTNTPMGRQKAMPPVVFARQITQRLQSPPASGTTEIFRGDQEKLAQN